MYPIFADRFAQLYLSMELTGIITNMCGLNEVSWADITSHLAMKLLGGHIHCETPFSSLRKHSFLVYSKSNDSYGWDENLFDLIWINRSFAEQ